MEISNLYERVILAQFAYEYVYQASFGLLGAIAVTAFIYDAIRGTLGGGTVYLRSLLGRILLATAALALYPKVVKITCETSTELARFMAENAGWDDYWDSVKTGFSSVGKQPLSELSPDAGFAERAQQFAGKQFDKITGLGKASLLTLFLSWSYFLLRLVFIEIQDFTALCATLLYVLGPLMITLGIVTQSRSLWHWLTSMVQVGLWPTIPPLLILVVTSTNGRAIETGNVAQVLYENLSLSLLGLSTPIVVGFLFGRLDIGSMGLGGMMASTALTSAAGLDGWVGRSAPVQHIPHPGHQAEHKYQKRRS